MRIVGGELRGRALKAPAGSATRPTTDRTREAVFNVLIHGLGVDLTGKRVLDLFAGTGALGLEALSRGAAMALFIEEGAEARGAIRTNVESLGLTGCTKIFRRDATRMGMVGTMQPFNLVFADPPYGKRLGEAALASARDGGFLLPGCVVILEEAANAPFTLPDGFGMVDERHYGDTIVRFMRLEALTKPDQKPT